MLYTKIYFFFLLKHTITFSSNRGEYPPSGGDEDDERFEISAETCIKSYQFESGKLVPFDEAWGKLPTMQLLKSDKTFVFDFGAEMYVWQGKEV